MVPHPLQGAFSTNEAIVLGGDLVASMSMVLKCLELVLE